MIIAKNVTDRRRQKYVFAQVSDRLKKFMNEFETIECETDFSIDTGADKIYGMTKVDCQIDCAAVQTHIDDFFHDFLKYRVNNNLLLLFNDFYMKIHNKYARIFEDFNEQIDWTDKRSYEAYFNMLQAWFKEEEINLKEEEEKRRKKAAESSDDHDYDDDCMENALPPLRNKTPLETRFEELITILCDDRNYVKDSLNKLHNYVKENKELLARFGKVPSFKEEKNILQTVTFSSGKKDIHSYIEPTFDILRFYWLSLRILTYMRHLYNCNELYAIDIGQLKQQGVYIDDGNDVDFKHFLDRMQKQSLNVANEACQLYMEKHSMNCASVRYLMAYKSDINYQSYIQSNYYELSKTENFNSAAKQILMLWIDNNQIYEIDVDKNYRDLVEAQSKMTGIYSSTLQIELTNQTKYDYREFHAQQEFISFYEKSFHNVVLQWIEGYLTLTNDHMLLQHLHQRFYIDGCHLTPFELQFILLLSAKMQITYRCNIKFLLLLCSSTTQNELVNVILYLFIIYHQAQRLHDMNIYDGLRLIENARFKALFAIKLDEYDKEIDANQIYKLILMLQNSSDNAEQLEKIPLREWIDIANKQKWSQIGSLIKKYGEVGYYLGFLDDRGRNTEERMMREVFDSAQYIPETLIAKISQFIVNNEVHADEDYFEKLRLILESGNDFSDFEITSNKRPYLITREFEQQKFIKYISQQCPDVYETLLPRDEREIDDMINLVTGLHDVTDEAKLARKNEIQKIGIMVKVRI